MDIIFLGKEGFSKSYIYFNFLKRFPTATYFGSAATGLGFYHVDIPTASESSWLNFKSVAVLKVVKGEVSASELLISS